jgi:hypothetical protein
LQRRVPARFRRGCARFQAPVPSPASDHRQFRTAAVRNRTQGGRSCVSVRAAEKIGVARCEQCGGVAHDRWCATGWTVVVRGTRLLIWRGSAGRRRRRRRRTAA